MTLEERGKNRRQDIRGSPIQLTTLQRVIPIYLFQNQNFGTVGSEGLKQKSETEMYIILDVQY